MDEELGKVFDTEGKFGELAKSSYDKGNKQINIAFDTIDVSIAQISELADMGLVSALDELGKDSSTYKVASISINGEEVSINGEDENKSNETRKAIKSKFVNFLMGSNKVKPDLTNMKLGLEDIPDEGIGFDVIANFVDDEGEGSNQTYKVKITLGEKAKSARDEKKKADEAKKKAEEAKREEERKVEEARNRRNSYEENIKTMSNEVQNSAKKQDEHLEKTLALLDQQRKLNSNPYFLAMRTEDNVIDFAINPKTQEKGPGFFGLNLRGTGLRTTVESITKINDANQVSIDGGKYKEPASAQGEMYRKFSGIKKFKDLVGKNVRITFKSAVNGTEFIREFLIKFTNNYQEVLKHYTTPKQP